MTDGPLTDEEVAELDAFGELSGRTILIGEPSRAAELWAREIVYGRVTPDPRSSRDGILGMATRQPSKRR
jgi:hypothetical protein